MIPRLTAGGTSFKGAALYYLHDKREEGEEERLTSDRVTWTYTLNLPTDDPERAWRMMAHTAMAQGELKTAAGIKATGRKLIKPVMAFSLSWSPDEPPPAPHEMLEAAQEALAVLDLSEHQAIVVAHHDTAHPHVHILVNRVNPVNGIAHKGSLSKLRLSAWAEAYEERRGKILCLDRAANNARRREARKPVRPRKISRPEWDAAKRDPAHAAAVAETLRSMFGDIRAIERDGMARRQQEVARLHAIRKAERQAIRNRYQAVADAKASPEAAALHAKLADALLKDDPARGLEGLTRDRSTFTRADLIRHVGRHTKSVQDFQAVLLRLETSPELVPLGEDEAGRQRFTTREHQEVERTMLDHARSLNARSGREVRPAWPKGLTPSRDQDAALRHIVAAKGLTAVIGYAGTGKSTMLAAARRSWEASGLRPIGMTISGVAADSLKNGSGIDSQTIARRLLKWDAGKDLPGPGDVIVVDEAGMIGSRQMERILGHAAQGGSKVVLVGDYEQLQAIDAGGAFRSLVGLFGAAKLETVRRQRQDWQQQATVDLATGRTEAALDRYRAAGMEHAHETGADARAALVAQWRLDRAEKPQASRIILAYNRADVADLNSRARAVLRETGQLGQDARLTTESGRKEFATGDRIYFLKNDAGLGVRNGTLATIKRIKGQSLVVRLDGEDGREVTFGMAYYNHIDHGYAATIHKSQGVTVDQAYLLASKSLNRHAAYVGMTRHRERLDVHWAADTFPNREKLVRTLAREALKDTSLDYDEAAHAERDRPARPGRTRRQPAPPPYARPSPIDPAEIGVRARERLRVAGEQRLFSQQLASAFNQPAASPAAPAPPLAIEGPRPEDRPMVMFTAELTAYDQETMLLVQALGERHEAEFMEEARTREMATLDAAEQWLEARHKPIEPVIEPARPMPLRKRNPGPSFDL